MNISETHPIYIYIYILYIPISLSALAPCHLIDMNANLSAFQASSLKPMTIEVPHPPWWNTRDRQAQPPGQPLPSRQLDLSTPTNNNINNNKKKKNENNNNNNSNNNNNNNNNQTYSDSRIGFRYVVPMFIQVCFPPNRFPLISGCRHKKHQETAPKATIFLAWLRLDANDSGWMPAVILWFQMLFLLFLLQYVFFSWVAG